jgi:GTP cyclohydrolase I
MKLKKKSADLAEVISGVRSMLKGLGIEDNEHTRETPYRVARAWEELLSGYFDGEPSVSAFESDYDEIVIVRDIEFVSICAHHMLPFAGKAHVGYLPNKKIVGLSKIPRIIEYFAKRLQVQEELAKQAAEYMMQKIEPRGVAVVIEAKHDCVACRGVKSKSAEMITSVMLGDFREHDDLKAEFLALLAGVKR